jgi:2-polyprenyl-6-methoxyphenol hydroxylase-like FAD-dependent oxidoreductase
VAGLRPERGGTAKASLTFTEPANRYDRIARADAERILTERMTGAGWRVDEFLAAMPAAPDFYFDSINQVRVDTWHRGRVVLIGDAGYCGSPLAGLGTSMSLVGAYVLAGELVTAGGDHERAFPAYQEVLTPYTQAGLELPPGGIKGFAPQSRFMIWLRAKSWNMMTLWPLSAIMRKVVARADAITLPDYSITGDRVYR